ncbi:MAG: sulfur transferase domain-containing protein [Bacteroidota bacterium]
MMAIKPIIWPTIPFGKNLYYITLVCLLFLGYGYAQQTEAQKLPLNGFKRLYKLNDSVYRSEQPNTKDFQELEHMGLKTIINFRRNKKDDRKARKTQLVLEHFPLKTKELTEGQILTALKMIQEAQKPVLLHCWHGSDRTGAISAAYRIVFENWDNDAAIKELRKADFGYHENWYPNVIDLLRNLDVVKMKK